MMTTSGLITNIQRCSTEDGPGIRTSVFLKGCPLHCIWCHNIETIDPKPRLIWHSRKCIADQACVKSCPEEALTLTSDGMKIDLEKCSLCEICEDVCPSGALEIMGKEWASNELVEELLRDRVFFETSNGGVTITGGEPLFQHEFATEIASGLKLNNIHVALDTSGYSNEHVWRSILQHIDLLLLDLKVMDGDLHMKYTGVPLERILENAKIASKLGIPVWIRTPIIPDHTDSQENIRAISSFIMEYLPTVERYDLLAFNKMCTEKYTLFGLEYPLKGHDLIEKEKMKRLADVARDEGVSNVTWSGMTKRDAGKSIKNANHEVS